MSKKIRRGEIWSALAKALTEDKDHAKRHGESVASLAGELRGDGDHTWLYKVMGGEHRPDAHLLVNWPAVTGERAMIDCICEHWGGTFTRKGEAGNVERGSLPVTIKECSDVFVVVASALADGHVDAKELRAGLKEIAEARQALAKLEADFVARAKADTGSHAATMADAERG